MFILTVVLSAFLWGYHKKSIAAWLRSDNSEATEEKSPQAAETPTVASPTANALPSPSLSPAPFPAGPSPTPGIFPSPQRGNQKDTGVVTYPSPLPSPSFAPPPPGGYQNPYQRFLQESGQAVPSPTPNSLRDTIDSIRPGESTDEQHIRRNAYFEKLSQQLKELRGDQNAEQAPPPPEAPVPEEVPTELVPSVPDADAEFLADPLQPLETEPGMPIGEEPIGTEDYIESLPPLNADDLPLPMDDDMAAEDEGLFNY